ncbi:phosphopantetheine-binding protein [Streptomyces physcomitrii]|uniref:phosphopantetheine-binding protein n=1 Tax=Streptomyces physcomitrii TaxID=2724184 RepID=UPI0034083D56
MTRTAETEAAEAESAETEAAEAESAETETAEAEAADTGAAPSAEHSPHQEPTAQAEEMRVAETLLGGLEIRTGTAFVIDGELDVARLAAVWARCGDRISHDAKGRRLFEVEPLAPPGDPVPESVRVSRDRRALAEPTSAALFSRLHRLTDGSVVWSVFVHHSVLDGVGLVFHMFMIRQEYLRALDSKDSGDAGELMWPYAGWEDSRELAAAMFTRRQQAEAGVLDLITDGGRTAPVLIGPKRRASTVPRVARLGQVRPRALPGAEQGAEGTPDAQASLAWLCGYTAVLLLAATGESAVQLSVPRAGVSRAAVQPLGSFAYTLPLAVRRPEDASVAEFLDGIAADIRDKRWSQCFHSGSLRRSFGPNVNLFPVDFFAGTDALGARWHYDLISSGPVEDVDIVSAFAGTALDVHAQVGMEGLSAADFRRVERALRAVLEDFAAADPATPAAEVLRSARAHLAPLTALNRELAAGAGAAGTVGGPAGEAAVRAAVAEVLRARYGAGSDPEEYDFFESGGSSLEAVNLVKEISEALGRPLNPATLFYHPTFAELVASIAAAGAEAGEDRAAGWETAGYLVLDAGAAGTSSAEARTTVLAQLLGQVAGAWDAHPSAGAIAHRGAGTDEGPVSPAADQVAELVTTAAATGLLSLRAEWPPGAARVRLAVRTRRATTEAGIHAAVARAAAACGLGPVAHSVFGEVFGA